MSNYYTARSREDLNIDTRTATEYGVVRTYFDAIFSWTTGTYSGNRARPVRRCTGPSAAAARFPRRRLRNNANAGAVAGGALGVYYAFIQFAGFTMGKAVSQFSTPLAELSRQQLRRSRPAAAARSLV